MKRLVVDGKRYVGLGDLYTLIQNMRADIREKYPRDDSGRAVIDDPEDAIRDRTLVRVLDAVTEAELSAAEGPEDLARIDRELRREWMQGKYLIMGVHEIEEDARPHPAAAAATSPNPGKAKEAVYFRRFCEHDGEETPTFTGVKRLAGTFDDHFMAASVLERLKRETDVEGLRVMALDIAWMSGEDAKKLLKAIFGDAESGAKPDADDGKG